jgi:hypothetical protein
VSHNYVDIVSRNYVDSTPQPQGSKNAAGAQSHDGHARQSEQRPEPVIAAAGSASVGGVSGKKVPCVR